MDTAETKFLEALIRVRTNEPELVAGLRRLYEQRRDALLKVREVLDVGNAQGRAQELRELLNLIETAGDQLAKAQRNHQR